MEDTLRARMRRRLNNDIEVLILVLMEDTLRDNLSMTRTILQVFVLILVLMEDTLRG